MDGCGEGSTLESMWGNDKLHAWLTIFTTSSPISHQRLCILYRTLRHYINTVLLLLLLLSVSLSWMLSAKSGLDMFTQVQSVAPPSAFGKVILFVLMLAATPNHPPALSFLDPVCKKSCCSNMWTFFVRRRPLVDVAWLIVSTEKLSDRHKQWRWYRWWQCRYLIDNGARLDAANNDNELPVDLADGDEMKTLLMQYMNKHGQSNSRMLLHLMFCCTKLVCCTLTPHLTTIWNSTWRWLTVPS